MAKSTKYPKYLDKTYICQRMSDKSHENSETSVNISEDSKDLWDIQDISFKVKNNLYHVTFSDIKKEAQCFNLLPSNP